MLAGQQMVVPTRDGEVRGERLNEDTFSVHILDTSGLIHVVNKVTREVRSLTMRGAGYDRLVKANQEPHNWLMYWGDYQGTHYSPLTQIDTTNVQRLQAAWAFPMPGDAALEATPLVIDGVMYTSQPGATVALDAATGRQLWRSVRPQKVKNPNEINPFSRGVAVLDQRLFVGTLDAALLALDVSTGKVALGDSGRRLDGGLHDHQPAAGRQRQGDCRRQRRRIRRPRVPRRLRAGHRQAPVALVRRARSRRIRSRHLARRQLEARRQADVAHRLV